ncbi:hypothetical protein KVR01_008873 [Diaporthe batatas]|uniref:uncharacterized protein n=1 Tax=Diaporthe batatas TaxID=748121 RepID=UPI001D0576D0|nr:uncharacterized protein KVR01_008873 [Diaporthe batatas]KAG8161886.1 hypothetical protein KVR01_008873 [Diaporthe batatas]
MESDNEEKRAGCQKPNSPSINEDESAKIDVKSPPSLPATSENTNEGGQSIRHTCFVSARLFYSGESHCDDLTQPLRNNKKTKTKNLHNSHTELETVMMSSSDSKQNENKTQDASGANGDQKQEVPPGPLASPTPLDKPLALRPLMMKLAATPVSKEPVENTSDDEFDGDSSSSSSTNDPFEDPQQGLKKPDRVSSWAKSIVSKMKPEDVDDDSPSRREWLRQKRENNEENKFLDQLMAMVGLEEVKAHFLAVKARVQARTQASSYGGAKQPELRLHMVLQGKDGTGKKTIAKLYAQFLYAIGAVETKVTARVSSLEVLKPGYSRTRHGKPLITPFIDRAADQLPGSEPIPSSDPPEKPSNPSVLFYDKNGPTNQHKWDDSYGMGLFTRNSPRRGKAQVEMEETRKAKVIKDLMKLGKRSVLILSSREKSFLELVESSETALQEFPVPLIISDYNENELRRILVRMVQKKGLSVEGGYEDRSLTVLVQRVARERKAESFSNVHTLQRELDKACRRRALRTQQEYSQWPGDDSGKLSMIKDREKTPLTSEDIMGPQPRDVRHNNTSWEKLQKMIGLEDVKAEFCDIIDYAQNNYRRQLLGMEPLKIGLNRIFLGPPGVGKTTVAQLYGQVLIDLGLVSGDKVLLRNPSHLIGAYVGHSEEKTKRVLDDARGNVLIIDDAHMLYPASSGAHNKTDIFRVAVLDTIVANVSADPEDRCILLLGYEHEMSQLFNNSNPGLQRRFPKETALHFETYSEDNLCQIMDRKAAECGIEMTEEARAVSRQVLGRMRINPKFGNAGDVGILLNQAKVRANARLRNNSHEPRLAEVVLEPGDIDPQWDRVLRADENRVALFDEFVGFKKIVKKFEGYKFLVDGMRLHGLDPRPHIPWAFIFKGPPGTGKTSTARKVGRLYYDMGLLSTEEVVTCSVSDLIGEAHGQTGPKVVNTLETGLGKVLFIDEAYRLAGGTVFQTEAIGELVDAMTQPRYNKNMVVILAGYTAEMELLLRTNPGLRSRFPEQVVFSPMTPRACFDHLRNELKELNISIPKAKDVGLEQMGVINELFDCLSYTTGWASGRDVETLAKTVIRKFYMREGRARKGGVPAHLGFDMVGEIIKALRAMCRERCGGEDSATNA